MEVLQKGETLISYEEDYSSGSIGWGGGGVNDAYDLYLVKNTSGKYILVVFMKIQFLFEGTANLKWTDFEKKSFADDFEKAIKSTWGNNRVVKQLKSQSVYVDFRFEKVLEGWCVTEHWEVVVKKIPKGAFSQSYVDPIWGKVSLDTEDLSLTAKGFNMKQRGVVHEFGHMLGLPDEYEVGTTHEKEYSAVMNRGETIVGRHDAPYIQWLNKVLTEKGIE